MGREDGTGDRKRGKTPEELAAVTGSDPERIRRAYEAIRIVDRDGNPIDEDGNPIDEDGNPIDEDGNPTAESESEEQEP